MKIVSQMALWEQSCTHSACVYDESLMAQPQHKWFVFLASLAKRYHFGKSLNKCISLRLDVKRIATGKVKMGSQIHFHSLNGAVREGHKDRDRSPSEVSLPSGCLSALRQEMILRINESPTSKVGVEISECSSLLLENSKLGHCFFVSK